MNKLFSKKLTIFGALLALAFTAPQLLAHPGHEHQHNFAYMIWHSLTHSGLFLVSVAIVVAALAFKLHKARKRK